MIRHHRTTIRTISFVLTFLLLFNTLSTSLAQAVSVPPQQSPTKKLINAAVGDLPDKLPKQRLELKSKRTEYSTRYLNPDGSFTEEIFLDAKYYKDSSDNQWKEIDNNLVASTKNVGKLENKSNNIKALFSEQTGTEEIASVEKSDMSIGLIPVDADNVSSSVINDEITYKNIYKDTDIRYKVSGNRLKEDIILNSYTGKNTYSFELKLKGLKAAEKDGIIYFTDKNNQKVWYLEKQFMTDANGRYSDKVTLTLRNENGKTYVDVTADNSFLTDSSTKYPVIIDPTINNWNVMSDTFISGTNPNSSYPGYASMYTGSTPSYGTTRSLIKFFLPSLPSDSKIIGASFNAYQTKVDAENTSVELYRITSSWLETATWNTQPTIKATAESAVTSNASNSYWQWYITQLVKDWYSGSAPNYGIMLKQYNEGTTPYRAFNSVNAVTNTPRLTINYTVDPTGLEDFWGYTKDNVNPANGNMVMQQTDLAISGRGIPVEITRTYNSRKSDIAGMFGYGWHSNVEAQLIDPGNGPIIFIDGDNTRHVFGEKVGGGYIAAGGIYLDLVKNGDNTYTITGVDGTKINFNTEGRISSIVDTNNNTTAYTYTSGKLSTITDASGRTVTITYGTNGYVSKITYTQAGRTVNYEYDTSNNLTKVTDPAGKFITMNYDSDHNITGLTDQRSIKTTIGYDTANDRVSTISRPITIDGAVQTSTTSYSYDTQNLVTTVTDGENKKVQYTYSANGNVVQITENPLDPVNKSVTTYTYDDYNNLTKVIVPNVNKEKEGTEEEITEAYVYSYDENGNITHVQLPEKQTATYSYDSQNNPTENIDFNGNSSSYSYDSNSNQLESTDANLQTAANRYWSNGNLWYSTNIMSAADNLITNSSVELDANSDNWPDNWTKITEAGKTAA